MIHLAPQLAFGIPVMSSKVIISINLIQLIYFIFTFALVFARDSSASFLTLVTVDRK